MHGSPLLGKALEDENVNADADAFENFKQEPSEGFVMLS